MPPEDVGFLHDLLVHAEKAVSKIEAMDFDAFMRNEDRRLAIEHLVMLVGECASRVSDELKASEPNVSWREASSVRNRIVHASFSVDYGVIYEVARDHLPELIQEVKAIIAKLDAPGADTP